MKIQFAIFDLTGTLIDQHSVMENIDEEFNVPFLKSKGFAIKPTDFKKAKEGTDAEMEQYKHRENKGYYDIDLWTKTICSKLGINYSKEFSDKWEAEFRKHQFSKLMLMEGAKEILEYLKNKNYTLILFTNSERKYAELKLKMFSINEYFDFIFVSEEIGTKFSALPFRTIIEKLGAKAEECIMIGNKMDEDMFAKKVGIKTVLIEDSRQKYYKDIETEEPDFRIKKLEELKNIL